MLGERIKAFRTAVRMTQEELAEKLFVSVGYISEIETGKKTPSLQLLVQIINLLGCSPNELFEYKEKDDKCEHCGLKNNDNTVSETLELLTKLGPDEKFKVYSYVKDQYFISEAKTKK